MDTRRFRLADIPLVFGKGPLFEGRGEVLMGELAGLSQFGVNHVTLAPGARSASRHWHEAEDELVLVLSGDLTLVDDNGEHPLAPGDFVGFPAGVANAHHILNKSAAAGVYIAVGSRKPGEETIHYPDDDFGPIRK